MNQPILKEILEDQGDRVSPTPESTPHEEECIYANRRSLTSLPGHHLQRQPPERHLRYCRLDWLETPLRTKGAYTLSMSASTSTAQMPGPFDSLITVQKREKVRIRSIWDRYSDAATSTSAEEGGKRGAKAADMEMFEIGPLGLSRKEGVPKAKEESRIGSQLHMKRGLPIEAETNGRNGMMSLAAIQPRVNMRLTKNLVVHRREKTLMPRNKHGDLGHSRLSWGSYSRMWDTPTAASLADPTMPPIMRGINLPDRAQLAGQASDPTQWSQSAKRSKPTRTDPSDNQQSV